MDRAVSRAFQILESLAHSGGHMRLTDIANNIGLQKSTVHRILATLIEIGYVTQNEQTGLYQPSIKIWELGAGVIATHPVKRAATGFMQDLHRLTGETVSLTIRSGDDVLYLDKIISPRPIRFTTRVGSRVPMPVTACGKAILAFDPDARAIALRVTPRLRPDQKFDLDHLMEELKQVREIGYSSSSAKPGVSSFGAPIHGRNGSVIAALSISAPVQRLSDGKLVDAVDALLSTCSHISHSIGQTAN